VRWSTCFRLSLCGAGSGRRRLRLLPFLYRHLELGHRGYATIYNVMDTANGVTCTLKRKDPLPNPPYFSTEKEARDENGSVKFKNEKTIDRSDASEKMIYATIPMPWTTLLERVNEARTDRTCEATHVNTTLQSDRH